MEKTIETTNTTICDKCRNYGHSGDSCYEYCFAFLEQDMIGIMTYDYMLDRMNGNKKSCMRFQKI